jgi:outer membrane usher protein
MNMSPQATPHSRALRAVAAVICALSALVALPATPAAAQPPDQRAILTLTVNQAPQGEAVVIARPDDVLVEPATLNRAGLRNYAGRRETIGGREYVSLASLSPGIGYALDEAALTLTITATSGYLGSARIDLSVPRPEYRFARATSGFVNYGVNWAEAAGTNGSVEAGLSIGAAVAQNTMSWDGRGGFVRGFTNVVVDQPDRLRRWTAGDSLLPAEGLGSGMLIGGVRVARDYGLDPYFIQYPTLGLSGTTLTPSTVDVYVNGSLVSRQTVSPGSFRLDNVPMPNGSNDTRVVVRDAFGREQQMTAPFYLTTAGLAKGLQDYDYAVGFPRLGGAATSWSYGQLSAVARHRYGFTDRLTAGVLAEADGTGLAGGPTLTVRLPRGDVGASASFSRMDGRSGAAMLVGVGHTGRTFNVSARVRSMTSGYSTLTIARPNERLKLEAAAVAGVTLASRISLSLQHAVTETHARVRSTQTSLVTSVRLGRAMNAFVNGSRVSQGGQVRTSLYAGLGFVLGALTSGNVFGQAGSGGAGASADVQRALPVGNGVGYRARAALGGSSQAEAVIEAQGRYGRYEAGQQAIDGQSSAHAGVAGGLVMIGGGVHPTRPVDGSYALVRVPEVGGVRTYLNNQETGRTNRRGDMLVPNLLPYYANRIGIADQDVPFDREIETVEQSIAPPYRGGALVTFRAARHQGVMGVLLVTVAGQAVVPALGELTLSAGDQAYSSPIGESGEFYFENVPAGEYTAVAVFKGGRCRFALTIPSSTAPVIRLGIVKCDGPVTPLEGRQP